MNIQEERNFIIKENNTAQQTLVDILETLSPETTRELHITVPLSGEVDFSILDSMGFKKVREIHLGEGKITDIIHIPKTVTELVCMGNMLISLNGLPAGLIRLNCSHNHLGLLKIGGLDYLVYLNCEHNELVELKDISESLEELYCDHNDITKLNLTGLDRLTVLHCSNNKLMVLQNLPTTLVDLKMDNNPLAEVEHIAIANKREEARHDLETDVKINYLESLNEYFKLKDKYMTKAHTMRKNAFKSASNKKSGKMRAARVKPPCVNCGRPVGSIFTKADEKYMALCGDSDSPCNLNIQLFTSDFYRPEDMLNSYREIVDDAKENIIRQKLDTLFNYVSETVSAQRFKKEFHKYTEANQLYSEFLDEYNKTYNNPHKAELMSRKNLEIQELLENSKEIMEAYNKTGNVEILKTAVRLYIEDISTKVENLRKTKFPVMEMYVDKMGSQKLVQLTEPISKYDYSYTEPPRVIQFQTK